MSEGLPSDPHDQAFRVEISPNPNSKIIRKTYENKSFLAYLKKGYRMNT